MRAIDHANIGTTLQMISKGNLESAPPIHIWTKKQPDGYLNLGIHSYTEYVEARNETPSAVIILTLGIHGGGPHLLYWMKNSDFSSVVNRWLANYNSLEGEEVKSMG